MNHIDPTRTFASERFELGCNYWGSHAGTFMWRDWRPEVVDADLAQLAENGITWLRVFPLWPDFQPIHQLRGRDGHPVDIRFGEEPLPDTELGRAGLSAIMLDRFAQFSELAQKHGLRLVVGLITGWMSGRLFVPPALEGLDPITNATSISWQVRFVRTFARHFHHDPAIAAWDLGNECNCMGVAPTPDAAYLWTATIANAIRAADPTRPIISGMHSLSSQRNVINNPWLIEHQGELTDILTTHPYPYWVRHTNIDAIDDLRTTLHATAEGSFYSDIGGKPCIAEEIGTMGPMIGGDQASADFIRVNMFSLWAGGCAALAWWCSHDQTELSHAPYDWNGVELELGLIRTDGTAKPVLKEMAAFRAFIDALPFARLPKPTTEAICLLTHNQDDWAIALSSFVLAKQAKLELAFRHIEQVIPEAQIYLMPSIKGPNCVPRRKWNEILARVREGATLYMSLGDGIVPSFNEIAGVTMRTRAKASGLYEMVLGDGTKLDLPGADDLLFEPGSAEILGRRSNGAPAYWRNAVGKGSVYVVVAPIEDELTRRPRAFSDNDQSHWKIYRDIAGSAVTQRLLNVSDPAIAVSQHVFPDGTAVLCLINHGNSESDVELTLPQGYEVDALRGTWQQDASTLSIARMDCGLLRLQPKG